MNYNSIQQTSFHGTQSTDARSKNWELKARISASNILKEKPQAPEVASLNYQTHQHTVHKSFGDMANTTADPQFI